MVRSRGSYWSTPRKETVVISTSAGAIGPAMRRFVELPHSVMVRFAAPASRNAAASSAGEEGASTYTEYRRCRLEIMYVNLPPELEMKLNELAALTGRPPESLALEAIEDRVEYDSRYHEQVRRGIED